MTNKEVIETLRYMKFYKADKDSTEPYALDLAIQAIEARPQGHWIEFKGGYYKCDKCGEVERAKKNFCSRCGADMRGDRE